MQKVLLKTVCTKLPLITKKKKKNFQSGTERKLKRHLNVLGTYSCALIVAFEQVFDPSRPNPGRREKLTQILFSHFFVVPQKVL